jgi:hypothetical protein
MKLLKSAILAALGKGEPVQATLAGGTDRSD